MGISVLETVENCLREAGFPAAAAYPGHPIPQIQETVAAFRIHKADSQKKTVTIEVTVLCPGHMGGAACEVAALTAAKALHTAGAACLQNGCQYDGLSQLYSAAILATFSEAEETDSQNQTLGFQVRINNVDHPFVTAFCAEKVREQTTEYAVRSPEGTAITSGCYHWNLRLEELVPYGSQETAAPADDFVLRVIRGSTSELYKPCRWSSVSRSFTAEGLRLICKGIALTGKEVSA